MSTNPCDDAGRFPLRPASAEVPSGRPAASAPATYREPLEHVGG
ncbi:hypothetical protein [Pseudonocardia sp. NPDC049635]